MSQKYPLPSFPNLTPYTYYSTIIKTRKLTLITVILIQPVFDKLHLKAKSNFHVFINSFIGTLSYLLSYCFHVFTVAKLH